MRLLAVLAFIGFSALATPAQAQIVMRNFNFDEMRLALQEVGSTIQHEDVDDAGGRSLQAKSKSGLVYTVFGAACDSKEPTQRCEGLNITCRFILKAGVDPKKAEALVDYAAIKEYIDDGDLMLSRYVIFDDGITPANLKANLNVFIDIADQVWGKLGDGGFLGDK